MKYVSSGSGKMPLITLLAVLSISLTINMPGLAVSPILSQLHHIFDTTVLESQLITSLPNLFMIPVVLIAGRLAKPERQTAMLFIGLSLFLVAGALCFWASSMQMLILLSCVIGVGCGIVVPIAAGAISEWWAGKPRQRDLGLKSMTSNAMIIIANLYVGWIAVVNWHAAFVVYLIPIVPLCLLPFMTQRYVRKHGIGVSEKSDTVDTPGDTSRPAFHFQGRESLKMLISLIILYMIATYTTMAITYYSPFLMEHYGMSTAQVGIVTAMFYLTCSCAGALVGPTKRLLGRSTMYVCISMCIVGLLAIGLTHNYVIYIIAALVTGYGYGIIQPIIYNKTTYVAPTRRRGTEYFGYVLSANYVAITLTPFLDSLWGKIFDTNLPGFEFIVSGAIMGIVLIWAIIKRRNYVFVTNPKSSAPTCAEVNDPAACPAEKDS